MDKSANGPLDWTGTWKYLPHAALGGLAVGAGGRLGKNLLDIIRGDPAQASKPMKRLTAPVSKIPIEVTPEEAEELEEQGIKVKKVLLGKTAQDVKASPWKAVGYGALGTAATLGGWGLADWIVDNLRKSTAEQERDRVRSRIQKILEGRPDKSDVTVYRKMKTASASHMVKVALIRELLTAGGLGVGSAAVLQGLAGYRKAKQSSRYRGRLGQLSNMLKRRKAAPPLAAMSPVVFVRDGEDEEDEEQGVEPVQVVEQSGSPAQQASVPGSQWI